jgi:hypothetical protein
VRRSAEWILGYFRHLVPANKCDVVLIIFVLNRKRVLNTGKLDQAAEDRRVALNSLASFSQTSLDLTDVLLAAVDLNIEVSVLLLVLGQKVFKVLMNSVQERVDFLERRLRQILDRSHAVIDHVRQFLALVEILLADKVKLVQQDLTALDHLCARKLKVLI